MHPIGMLHQVSADVVLSAAEIDYPSALDPNGQRVEDFPSRDEVASYSPLGSEKGKHKDSGDDGKENAQSPSPARR